MEGRLFLLSIWCGIYGQFIRVLYRKGDLVKKTPVLMIINSLFWATFAAMAGMLVASYTERLDQTNQFLVIFAIAGLVIGALLALMKSSESTAREALIKDNLEWADTGFSAILLASFVMFFVVQAFKIPSGSMRMTFIEGDHLFVNKFIYGIPVPLTEKKLLAFKKIKTNDIVIFRFPAKNKDDQHYGKDFIKRTVALSGQKVQLVNKDLYVDDRKVTEPFKQHVDPGIYSNPGLYKDKDFQEAWERGEFAEGVGNDVRDNFGPVIVPPGHIFVMGDNRDRSFDSRFWGPLKISAVKGKAWLLYWPLNRFRFTK